MADLATSLQTAKKAGYSDKEITDYLAQDPSMGAKVATARQAGYGDDEIVAHLADSVAKPAAPAKPAPKPAPSLWDEVVGAGAAAVDKFKSDAKTAFVDRPKEQSGRPLAEQVMRAPADIGQTAADVGRVAADALGVVVSPAAGAMHAVVRPAAEAINKGIGPQYTRPTFSDAVAGLQGKRPQWRRELTPAEAQTETENALNTALSALPAGKPAVANALASTAAVTPKIGPMAAKVAQFEQAGVRPSLAAVGGDGAASAAKMASENFLVGGRARNALRGSLDDTAAAADRQAANFGQAADRGAVGEAVQGGVKDFNTRFSERAGKLYDNAFTDIQAGEKQAVARATADAARRNAQGAGSVAPAAVIAPDATTAAVRAIQGRGQSPALKKLFTSPQVQKLAAAVDDPASLSFQDLRDARTWVREAKSNETLRGTIGDGNLQSLEGALTQDITANAERLAGPQAARKLKQADQFYRLGNQRIEGALQNFVGKASSPKPGEGTYDMIIRAASDKGGADSGRLLALKKSLQPGDWGDVSATVIKSLGKPTAGAADVSDFSVNRFVTNYANLSDRGKSLLFGNGAHRAALDNLAEVAGMQKGVERAANHSNTAVVGQSVATVGGLLNLGTTVPTLGALSGIAGLGELMTNPAAVRWITRAARAEKQSPAAYSNTVKQLGYAAKTNVQLLPLYQSLALEAPRATISAAAQEEPGNSQ